MPPKQQRSLAMGRMTVNMIRFDILLSAIYDRPISRRGPLRVASAVICEERSRLAAKPGDRSFRVLLTCELTLRHFTINPISLAISDACSTVGGIAENMPYLSKAFSTATTTDHPPACPLIILHESPVSIAKIRICPPRIKRHRDPNRGVAQKPLNQRAVSPLIVQQMHGNPVSECVRI